MINEMSLVSGENGPGKCPTCGKKLAGFSCLDCLWTDYEAIKKDREIKNVKKERLKRASKDFIKTFDNAMLDFAIEILKTREKVIIKELIDLFEEEGMFKDLEATQTMDKDGQVFKIYKNWAIKYTIKMAKVWHQRGDVFIGARQIKGHPYEIYLPEDKEKILNSIQEIASGNIELSDVLMPFGKYKGKQIKWIAENEPGYIVWLQEKAQLREGNLKRSVENFYLNIIKPK